MIAPHLTALNGCTSPVENVVARLGDIAFHECPARFVEPGFQLYVDLALADAFRNVSPLERLHVANFTVEAIEFAQSILPKAEPTDGRSD